MNLDLNNLIDGWPHEPGQVSARKIIGNDGREKLQLRIDLGLIQMEMTGRPDGQRPNGSESLLAWFQERAEEAEQAGEPFALTQEECTDLQNEGIQYYHRYVALFQLGDYPAVIRDTQRNLDLFAFVAEHAERDELADSFTQFRPYVIMMNTRARASIELDRHDIAAAIRQVERGRDKILEALQESAADEPEGAEPLLSPEVEFLEEWLQELKSERPISRLEALQREMDRAIAAEAYERAAELRDAIKAHQASIQD